ncbi:SCO family protein [Microbulbifer spongiae]|uniref:SCO family protein n=1 Tax=Microbulbifer spongiae TaxID=2944933 RepID=A0ABY9E891_9GAMM|nr:SCO family protein [Microbulbifer sp. MI-G]WKD49269.1 SCO family protein [Microbulbifer sp. MI-G]
MSRLTPCSNDPGIDGTENENTGIIQSMSLVETTSYISLTDLINSISGFFCQQSSRRRTQTRKHKILNRNAQWITTVITGFMAWILPCSSAWSFAELPDDSVYHAESQWRDQNGNEISISDLQGKVQVIAFVYTYCQHSCPVILSNLRSIEKKIASSDIPDVQFTLISLDPGRDSPEVLKRYMQEHDLDECRWLMLNGNPDEVLEFSALLGVRYRPMNNNKKDIAHSNMITVLDRQGKISYQMKGLNTGPEAVVSTISKLILSDTKRTNTLSSSNCLQSAKNGHGESEVL